MPHFTLQIDATTGPLITVYVGVSAPHAQALQQAGQTPPPLTPIRALIDTGASNTCVDTAVIQQLGLQPISVASILTPSTGSTPHMVNQYDVALAIPSGVGAFHMLPTLAVTGASLSHQGFEALIGRDILKDCILVYNGSMGFFTLAY